MPQKRIKLTVIGGTNAGKTCLLISEDPSQCAGGRGLAIVASDS